MYKKVYGYLVPSLTLTHLNQLSKFHVVLLHELHPPVGDDLPDGRVVKGVTDQAVLGVKVHLLLLLLLLLFQLLLLFFSVGLFQLIIIWKVWLRLHRSEKTLAMMVGQQKRVGRRKRIASVKTAEENGMQVLALASTSEAEFGSITYG